MPACTILSTGIIPNDAPVDSASNPWECHDFMHNTLHAETGDFALHVAWSIAGDIPNEITIDPGSGVISGNVKPLNYQDTGIVNDIIGKQPLKIDGSNFKEIGRPDSPFYLFSFTITRAYMIWVVKELGTMAPEVATSDVTIKVIKNHDIDNLIYIKEYLKPGTSMVNGFEKKHTMNIDGVSYDKDSVDACIANHPGPFNHCGDGL